MKILLVSPLPPPEGGIAIWTKKYKRYCEEHQQPLTIVNTALVGSRAAQINSKRNYMDEFKRTYHVLREMRRQLRKEQPDVVHLNTSCSRFGIHRDWLCMRLAAKQQCPVVLHCRCNIEDQLNHRASSIKTFEKMSTAADRILVLNRKSYEYANLLAPGKVTVVPNFAEKSLLSESFEVRDKIEHVVFVGHVQKTKGAEELLAAAKALPEIQFHLVGPVHETIQNAEHPVNVEFVGNVEPEQVRQHLTGADVFVFPTYTEGFSNALMEAMACGLPVVTTPVGANREMIEDQGGCIVPVGDGRAIVKALQEMQPRAVREAMSQWNMEKVRSSYLIDAVMQKLLGIYQDVTTL